MAKRITFFNMTEHEFLYWLDGLRVTVDPMLVLPIEYGDKSFLDAFKKHNNEELYKETTALLHDSCFLLIWKYDTNDLTTIKKVDSKKTHYVFVHPVAYFDTKESFGALCDELEGTAHVVFIKDFFERISTENEGNCLVDTPQPS